ncbi:MAG: polysaccharide pyruvyl transferase CsaB [Candidatus Margulisiibacteriota bacterium]
MNIFIIGYYGFQNAGDEMLLKKTVTLLKETRPSANLCVLYNNPPETKGSRWRSPYASSALFKEITYCNRKSFREKLMALLRSDVVVFGGGGLLQNATSNRSLLYYGGFLLGAWLLGKKTLLLSQGIGPLWGGFANRFVGFLVRRARFVSVRDEASASCLRRLGVQGVHLIPDLAFWKGTSPPLPVIPEAAIGLSVRTIGATPAVRTAVMSFLTGIQHPFIFLNFQSERDYRVVQACEPIHRQVLEVADMNQWFVEQKTPQWTVSHVIGMRFHACVWAALQGVPFFALGYDPKVVALAKTLGQPCINLSVETLDAADIQARYEQFLAQLDRHRQTLRTQTQVLVEQADALKPLLDVVLH